jgi:hypothetical protein
MIANLKARGMNLNVWITNRDQNDMTTDPQLNPYKFTTGCVPAGCTTTPGIDIRDPIPYNRFKQVLQTGYPNRLSSYISMGITGFKIDRGDQGDIPDALQPELAYLIPKMAYEASYEYNGAEGFTFSRNVYDRGRKYVAIWTGDAAVSFTGMSDALKQLVRLGNIMMHMVGSDTGGYNSATNKELFARWIGMNAHMPYMEILLGPNRTPWNPPFTTAPNNTPPLLTTIFTKWTQEHQDMIPYTRSWMKHASQYGMPVVRALPARLSGRSDGGRHVQPIHVRGCVDGGADPYGRCDQPLGIPAGRQLDRLQRQGPPTSRARPRSPLRRRWT